MPLKFDDRITLQNDTKLTAIRLSKEKLLALRFPLPQIQFFFLSFKAHVKIDVGKEFGVM